MKLKELPKNITPMPDYPAPNIEYRKLITAIEKKVWALPGAIDGKELPLRHMFAEGVYMRELTIPEGLLVVGELHRDSYVNCFMEGDMTILTSKGVKRVKAPKTIVSPPETKRFGYAHKTVKWITVHPNPTNSTNIEELEKGIHAEGYHDLKRVVIPTGIEKINVDRIFKDFCNRVIAFDGKFNIKLFRALTKKVFSKEKPGLYKHWTKEQKELYKKGDWESFSKSRGYTEEEIDELRLWIDIKDEAEKQGCNPIAAIEDFGKEALRKSLELGSMKEVIKSNWIPTNRREKCQEQ